VYLYATLDFSVLYLMYS